MKRRRFLAYLIDGYVVLFLLYFLSGFLSKNSFLSEGAARFYGFFLLYFTYYFVSEYFFKKTLGKLVTGMSVEKVECKFTWVRSIFRRTLARLIPFDQISIFFYDDDMMWHDQISDTKVVKDKKGKKDNAPKSDIYKYFSIFMLFIKFLS